jgi:hypothetical protein
VLLVYALDALIEAEVLCVGPEKFALPNIEPHVGHEVPEGIGDFDRELASGRAHPVE